MKNSRFSSPLSSNAVGQTLWKQSPQLLFVHYLLHPSEGGESIERYSSARILPSQSCTLTCLMCGTLSIVFTSCLPPARSYTTPSLSAPALCSSLRFLGHFCKHAIGKRWVFLRMPEQAASGFAPLFGSLLSIWFCRHSFAMNRLPIGLVLIS